MKIMQQESVQNIKPKSLIHFSPPKQMAKELRGKLDVTVLARILSDHSNRERDPMDNPILEAWGYSICNHGTRHQDTYPHENLPWGTVSAEIMQPSKKLFWFAYGWPCGEQPEFGDQIHQEKSWGKFIPFGFHLSEAGNNKNTVLATVDGDLTPAGLESQEENLGNC